MGLSLVIHRTRPEQHRAPRHLRAQAPRRHFRLAHRPLRLSPARAAVGQLRAVRICVRRARELRRLLRLRLILVPPVSYLTTRLYDGRVIRLAIRLRARAGAGVQSAAHRVGVGRAVKRTGDAAARKSGKRPLWCPQEKMKRQARAGQVSRRGQSRQRRCRCTQAYQPSQFGSRRYRRRPEQSARPPRRSALKRVGKAEEQAEPGSNRRRSLAQQRR